MLLQMNSDGLYQNMYVSIIEFSRRLNVLRFFGPFVSFFAEATIIVIASENRITLRVHPVIIPFSSFCHCVVNSFVGNLI